MSRTRSEASHASFEALFEREHVAMVRLAYLLLGSESLAEEAVQDAFARVLDRFDRITNSGAYLRTATVNRCRDLLRRRKLEERSLGWLRLPTTNELESDDMMDVLSRLDQHRREVIVLRFYLGHTSAEIAALLDIPEGTVRSRMQRGIDDLREALR